MLSFDPFTVRDTFGLCVAHGAFLPFVARYTFGPSTSHGAFGLPATHGAFSQSVAQYAFGQSASRGASTDTNREDTDRGSCATPPNCFHLLPNRAVGFDRFAQMMWS